MDKIAIVTGGTSGIGFAVVNSLCARGYKVYSVSRRSYSWSDVNAVHIEADVTDEESLKRAFKKVTEVEKRLDLLVACAGFGIAGAVEFTSLKDAKKQFDVNFFGAFLAMKCASEYMRENGHGRIIAISSVAGEIAIPFQAFYSASKAALIKLVDAYSLEVAPYGIDCTVILPGDIATPFTAGREKSPEGDEQYSGRISKGIAKMEKDEINGISAEVLGEFIADVATKRKLKPYYGFNGTYALLIMLYRIVPRSLALRIVKRLYA